MKIQQQKVVSIIGLPVNFEKLSKFMEFKLFLFSNIYLKEKVCMSHRNSKRKINDCLNGNFLVNCYIALIKF